MAGLYTEDLTIGYETDLIGGISIKAEPGKIVTLIGPNGSGKSTLLKTITGELKKRGGLIFLDGDNRDLMSAKEAAKKLSMVMTEKVRPELMTCKEVIESGRYPYTGMFGRLSNEDNEKVREAMEATETADLENRLFVRLSDGQRQRVLLARALCQEPDVLVLDEPTSFLDIRYKIDILTRIKQLAKSNNIAVIMSLHEPEIAMKLSDTVVAVGEGRVMRIGSVEEVFEEGFIRKLYKLGDMDTGLLSSKPYLTSEINIKKKNFKKGVIMIQGTMSNVGKSVIAAGLCRVFAQDGYKVAPFKSQNMANNSYVTKDGLEIGRAQAMQASCCNVPCDVRMNPVLLKPTDNCGSQVVVMGEALRNMKASEYFEYKKELMPVISKAYESLREEYDIVVIEGAGSPAEINLKDNDIVNMGIAEMADAPVLLVGDIDRGGVFAQLLGTLDLLEEKERRRVTGLVINKFRGDKKLLENGLEMLSRLGRCPVIGVVPYTELQLEDEDSLSDRLSQKERKVFDIAVLKLPHISNYTDLIVFDQIDEVSVRYVRTKEELDGADMVVIPGSKNTIEDMKFLLRTGMADKIRDMASSETVIFGICGGYQILGEKISDPGEWEGGGSIEGLKLLPVNTVLSKDKKRKIYEGNITYPTGVLKELKGCRIQGYEIHTGISECLEPLDEFTSSGTGYCRGNVYGTYVHGIFDTREAVTGITDLIAKAKGKKIDLSLVKSREEHLRDGYDALADMIRESLDMESIYRIMGLEHDKR